MKSNLYNINNYFVNAADSTKAIAKLKKQNKVTFAIFNFQKICNVSEIIPTTEKHEMKIFEIFGNEHEGSDFESLFISAAEATDAFIKYKEYKPKATRLHAKEICSRDEIILATK